MNMATPKYVVSPFLNFLFLVIILKRSQNVSSKSIWKRRQVHVLFMLSTATGKYGDGVTFPTLMIIMPKGLSFRPWVWYLVYLLDCWQADRIYARSSAANTNSYYFNIFSISFVRAWIDAAVAKITVSSIFSVPTICPSASARAA